MLPESVEGVPTTPEAVPVAAEGGVLDPAAVLLFVVLVLAPILPAEPRSAPLVEVPGVCVTVLELIPLDEPL